MHKNIFFFFQIVFFCIFQKLTKIGFFNTGFVFFYQPNTKQKLVKKHFELGRTRSNHFGLGRCCQPIKQWASPLFTCNVNGGEEDAKEEEEGGGG